ncbi:glycosyltransferase family 4 protein [Spirosoma oryzicola]|uniref:glycosyltransferase family 4 protein n=1 Tax=Spirosoma oryzicola TaxID=2898794 RepID=UPI001E28C38C|nr:glycosyltransferase family 1 protein [Spirosoma oryzicola]UHG92655.1 glycosyltransferase family 4 protein [Spirosoma oryzicola]
MNIILDASPLGIGFYHRQAQTGISRVVEQLLAGLQRADDVELQLAAPTHLAETMRFAQLSFGQSAPPFVNPPSEQALARFENRLLGSLAPGKLPSKLIRELAFRLRRATGREMARFDKSDLPTNAVYHSPFFPIPESLRNRRTLPLVQTIHDLIPIRHPEWFTSGEQTVKKVLATLSSETWVTTVSQATKDDFCEHTGFDPARVVPIRLAASSALFYPVTDETRKRAVRQKLGIGDEPYLLSLATLEPRKNIAHLIRSFGRMIDGGDLPADVRLVLVGTKGWKFNDIMAEASKNAALASRLIFTGFVQDDDLAPLYSGALAFVYPSLYEGFGLPPLEAMQCGVPIVTSDIPALAEVVGEAAIRVPPTDTDALCQAIGMVVNSPAVRTELSDRGRKQATQFSWDKFTAEHVALYKRTVG